MFRTYSSLPSISQIPSGVSASWLNPNSFPKIATTYSSLHLQLSTEASLLLKSDHQTPASKFSPTSSRILKVIEGDRTSNEPEKRCPHSLANSMHSCVCMMLAHQYLQADNNDDALKILLSEPLSVIGVVYWLTSILLRDWTQAEKVLRAL